MKYHYFHGRFTYSVKRSGLAVGRVVRDSVRAAVLDSCVEARAVSALLRGGRCLLRRLFGVGEGGLGYVLLEKWEFIRWRDPS